MLDVLGGPAFADNLAVLAPRGRLILLGFLAGSASNADLVPILRKRLEVIGTMMRTRGLDERIPLVRDFTERMLPLFDQRIEHAAPLRPVWSGPIPWPSWPTRTGCSRATRRSGRWSSPGERARSATRDSARVP